MNARRRQISDDDRQRENGFGDIQAVSSHYGETELEL